MKIEDINFLLGVLVNCLGKCQSEKECERLEMLIMHFIIELNLSYKKERN